MKSQYRISLACVLVTCIIFCSFLSLPVNAASEAKNIVEEKIDSVLMEKLTQISDEEKVDVSVWFTDIDQDEFEDDVKAKVNEKIARKQLSDKVIKVFDKNLSADELRRELKDIDESEFQNVVETKRRIHVNKQTENNTDIYNSLFPEKKWSWSELNYVATEQPEIIYQSKLTPNIEMRLTKRQILEIASKNVVEKIYAIEDNIVIEDNSYSTACFENTGIRNLNSLDFTGEGVKIGVIDSGLIKVGAPYFSNADITSFSNTSSNSGDHGNNVACILVGKQDDYCGVAPDAELFYFDYYSVTGSARYKSAIEWLVAEKQVNVVNISMSLSSVYGDTKNQYNEISRWLDHISYQDNVTIVMSSGNINSGESNGVWSGNMGYNVITVGAYNDKNTLATSDDVMRSDSRYNSATTSNCVYTYKPDIVAPGSYIYLPSRPSNEMPTKTYFDGTSAATPFVTGSVALLMEADPYLKTRPDLVKALIMVGANAENFMTMSSPNTSESTEAALSRQYGAGALNVQNSLSCVSTSSYPKYYTGMDSSLQTTKTVIVPYSTKLLRVALCYSKCNYDMDDSGHEENITDDSFTQVSLPNVSLKVTAPDGTSWYCQSVGNNVQLLSMDVSECAKGTYTITIFRSGPPTANTYYSIAVLNGDVLI